MNLRDDSVVSENPTRRGMEVAASGAGDIIPFQFRYHLVAERAALREHPVSVKSGSG